MKTKVVSPSGWVVLDSTGRFGVILKRQRKRKHCTWCGIQVAPPRSSWCSDGCTDAYQATQPTTLRRLVYRRDEGICSRCGIDCDLLRAQLSSDHTKVKPPDCWPAWWEGHLLKHGSNKLWQMDHTTPLHLGGDPFDLNNLTTLCVICHSIKTRAEASERNKT